MHIFLALGSSDTGAIVINDLKYPNVLCAYPYKGAINLIKEPQRVMTDSGAFTAWNIGKDVDLLGYRDWALSQQLKFKDCLAVNLDVIPGEAGRSSTPEERHQGMIDSLKNADFLRGEGLRIMEVFHQDEPWSFLDDLCDRLPENDVLGLSPRNDVSLPVKVAWQKQVAAHLYRRYGTKKFPKCHGLAATGRGMVETFPYYSVDSSVFMNPQRFGSVVSENGRAVKTAALLPWSPRMSEKYAIVAMVRHGVENLTMIERHATSLWKARGISWD